MLAQEPPFSSLDTDACAKNHRFGPLPVPLALNHHNSLIKDR
jgi:hypothetical protein